MKKLKRLILPPYIYNLVYGLIAQLPHRFGFQMGGSFTLYNLLVAPINDGHQFIWNLGGWFIIPLYMVQVCTVLFRKALGLCCRKTPEGICTLIGIALGIVFYMRVAVILELLAARSRAIDLLADSTYSIMMDHLLGILPVKSLFACVSRITPLFSSFDWQAFHTDIWWYYMPRGVSYTLILYVIDGLAFPILVQRLITYASSYIRIKKHAIGERALESERKGE